MLKDLSTATPQFVQTQKDKPANIQAVQTKRIAPSFFQSQAKAWSINIAECSIRRISRLTSPCAHCPNLRSPIVFVMSIFRPEICCNPSWPVFLDAPPESVFKILVSRRHSTMIHSIIHVHLFGWKFHAVFQPSIARSAIRTRVAVMVGVIPVLVDAIWMEPMTTIKPVKPSSASNSAMGKGKLLTP